MKTAYSFLSSIKIEITYDEGSRASRNWNGSGKLIQLYIERMEESEIYITKVIMHTWGNTDAFICY